MTYRPHPQVMGEELGRPHICREHNSCTSRDSILLVTRSSMQYSLLNDTYTWHAKECFAREQEARKVLVNVACEVQV